MTEKLTELPTARRIIDALGGEAAVADMVGLTPKAVNNWANWDILPRGFCIKMLWELNQIGYTASPRKWGQLGCEGLGIRRVSK